MKKLKVLKFGGTSMASLETLEKVSKIIKQDSSRRVVVVSAPGKRFDGDSKVTDLLYQRNIEEVEKRFSEFSDLEDEFKIIRKKLKENCDDDYVASRGEYLMAKVLSEKLGFEFIDASELFKFKKRVFDIENTKKTIKNRLKDVKAVVIPGFYGANENDDIVTFARGGSDFSGAVIASALGASVYENWTDVDGVFMCNPKIVKNPKKLDTMTYDELRELSYMGASVLQEDCVFPIRDSGTKIHILNTFNENSTGTVIGGAHDSNGSVTGISGLKNLFKIVVQKKRPVNKKYMIRETLRIFEKHKILLEFALVDIDSCSFIVRPFDNVLEIKKEIENKPWSNGVKIEKEVSTIVVIGGGFNSCPNVFSKVFDVLCENHVGLKFINFNEHGNMFIGVSSKNFERTIRKLYAHFQFS